MISVVADADQARRPRRAGAHTEQQVVAAGARRAHELVVGGPEPLAIEVVQRAEPVEDHAPRLDLALGGDRQHLVDAAAELGVGDHLAEDAAHRLIERLRRLAERLSGRDGDRERVDVQRGRRRRDEADLHGGLMVKQEAQTYLARTGLVATIRGSPGPKPWLVATIHASRAPKPWLVATIRGSGAVPRVKPAALQPAPGRGRRGAPGRACAPPRRCA